jgi:hypothetical protein
MLAQYWNNMCWDQVSPPQKNILEKLSQGGLPLVKGLERGHTMQVQEWLDSSYMGDQFPRMVCCGVEKEGTGADNEVHGRSTGSPRRIAVGLVLIR